MHTYIYRSMQTLGLDLLHSLPKASRTAVPAGIILLKFLISQSSPPLANKVSVRKQSKLHTNLATQLLTTSKQTHAQRKEKVIYHFMSNISEVELLIQLQEIFSQTFNSRPSSYGAYFQLANFICGDFASGRGD